MRMVFLVLAASTVFAQGTEPKEKASDYPVHTQVGDLWIGAEYMVHSISGPSASFIAEDYLVVEVALYPPRTGTVVRSREWTLNINGKNELLSQTPGMVAHSIRYADQNWRRRLIVGAGPVILGGPARVERFPGDPTARVPGSGEKQGEDVNLAEVIQRLALLEGDINRPIAGYLFFPWSGKTSKIKSVALIWRPETGEPVVLKLR